MIRRSLTFGLFLRLLPVLALAAALPWTFAYWIDHGCIAAATAADQIGDADRLLMQKLSKDHGLRAP